MQSKKRGASPKGLVKIKWSSDFAYAIGLIATDGNLSSDGRHLCFTSKELIQIKNFQKALGIDIHVGKKARGQEKDKKYLIVQFSDVLFYEFLISIGLTPAKSKTLGRLVIPDKYFFDFLRGCLDGDGYSYTYWDPRWRSSFMFYLCLVSASPAFIDWVRKELKERMSISGHITKAKKISICYQLKYSKVEAVKLAKAIYKNTDSVCLERKRLKIKKSLDMIGKLKRLHS